MIFKTIDFIDFLKMEYIVLVSKLVSEYVIREIFIFEKLIN